MLPDGVSLEIFDLYLDEYMDEDLEPHEKQRIEEWITLAHVCRRWRSVVFQLPHRLNLRLFCTSETPARDTLDISMTSSMTKQQVRTTSLLHSITTIAFVKQISVVLQGQNWNISRIQRFVS